MPTTSNSFENNNYGTVDSPAYGPEKPSVIHTAPDASTGHQPATTAALNEIITLNPTVTADDLDGLAHVLDAAFAGRVHPDAFTHRVDSDQPAYGRVHSHELHLNPLALLTNPANDRTNHVTAVTRDLRFNLTGETAGFPQFTLNSPTATDLAGELRSAVADTKLHAGLTSTIKPGTSDYFDLQSIGLHGVLSPITVTPVQYITPNGDRMWTLMAYDGNRRLQMTRRIISDILGLPADHLDLSLNHLPAGTLADMTAGDVQQILRMSGFPGATVNGLNIFPASTSDDDIAAFRDGPHSDDIRIRTLHRLLATPVRLLIGYDAASLVGPADPTCTPSPMAVLATDIADRMHEKGRSQTEHSDEARSFRHGTELARMLNDTFTGPNPPAIVTPLIADDVTTFTTSSSREWSIDPTCSSPDDENHPVRFTARTFAAVYCTTENDTATYIDTIAKQKGSTAPAIREGLATALTQPTLLGVASLQPGATSGGRGKAHKSIWENLHDAYRSEFFNNPAAYPQGATDLWYEHLGDSIASLCINAARESRTHHAQTAAAQSATAKGATWHGPHGRALVALAMVAAAGHPALRYTEHQFKVGKDIKSPDLYDQRLHKAFFLLLTTRSGIKQLGEILRTALNPTVTAPLNTVDPTLAGQPITNTTLREHVQKLDAIVNPPAVPSPADKYRDITDRFTAALQDAERLATSAASDPDLQDLYQQDGFPDPAALTAHLTRIGDLIAAAGTGRQQAAA